jgi:hypothetical protein
MYPHPAEDWAALRRTGQWRFIVSNGVRSAISTAFGGIILCLSLVAYWAYRDGQTLDFRWFQIVGQPGAQVFFCFHHVISLLLVAFLFSLVFWLFAGAQCWWLNERVHRDALGKQNSPPPALVNCENASALSAILTAIGKWSFLGCFFYVPLANHWPQLRLAPLWQDVLLTIGVVGAGLVWGVSFVAWIVDAGTGLRTLIRRRFRCDRDQIPALAMLTHPTLGPVDPPDMAVTSPSLRRHRVCWHTGASLLLCAFILSSPLGPFPGALIFTWLAYLGVGILLCGVGFAAHGSSAALLQKPPHQPTSDRSAEVAPAKARPMWIWVVLFFAAVMCAVIPKLLGFW